MKRFILALLVLFCLTAGGCAMFDGWQPFGGWRPFGGSRSGSSSSTANPDGEDSVFSNPSPR